MKVTPDEIRFIAGVIDARGHIEVNQRHNRPQPRIRVTTKRHQLLEWLAAATGTKVRRDNRGYERRPCSAHCRSQHVHVVRQSSYWTVDSGRATIVLYAVQPFIVCQVDEVRHGLLAGLAAFPSARSATPVQMEQLGWPLPSEGRLAA